MTIGALAAAIAPGVPVEEGQGQVAIDRDAQRLDALLDGDATASGLRLWTNSRCLVTTRRHAAAQRFAQAAAASAGDGWPVCVRSSGGTTVAHRPGMLNISHFASWKGEECDVTRRFERFCGTLVEGLRSVGVEAETGWVPFSHCDGRFNVVAAGRKIGGTASLVRRRGTTAAMLSHATIWLDGAVEDDLNAIERFERDLGCEVAYAAQAHATLCDVLAAAPAAGMREARLAGLAA